MNTGTYKQKLLAMEQKLVLGLNRTGEEARDLDDSERDIGDESSNDEIKGEKFTEADSGWKLLNQVRDALKRIEDGTYGKCAVDGGEIEEKRLEAVPWTRYCAKHARELEPEIKTPTL